MHAQLKPVLRDAERPVSRLHTLRIETSSTFEIHDLTAQVRELVVASGVREGQVMVSSLHTTTAITVNENEPRLFEDLRQTLDRLIPPGLPYLHDDIAARGCPADEPLNAHAHIAAMMLGHAQTVPITDGDLVLGQWQSVLFIELDGARSRSLVVQIVPGS